MGSLFFLTGNDYKFREYARLTAPYNLSLIRWRGNIQEIQELDLRAMARHKAIEAYKWLLHPVLVDVSGMRLGALDGLPGGLNRQFWEVLHENICEVVHRLGDPTASMVVTLALCDGKRVHLGEGETGGTLAERESQVGTFHLDRTFIPTGAAVPLSEMCDAERDVYAPRAAAVASLLRSVHGHPLQRELGIREQGAS